MGKRKKPMNIVALDVNISIAMVNASSFAVMQSADGFNPMALGLAALLSGVALFVDRKARRSIISSTRKHEDGWHEWEH